MLKSSILIKYIPFFKFLISIELVLDFFISSNLLPVKSKTATFLSKSELLKNKISLEGLG